MNSSFLVLSTSFLWGDALGPCKHSTPHQTITHWFSIHQCFLPNLIISEMMPDGDLPFGHSFTYYLEFCVCVSGIFLSFKKNYRKIYSIGYTLCYFSFSGFFFTQQFFFNNFFLLCNIQFFFSFPWLSQIIFVQLASFASFSVLKIRQFYFQNQFY